MSSYVSIVCSLHNSQDRLNFRTVSQTGLNRLRRNNRIRRKLPNVPSSQQNKRFTRQKTTPAQRHSIDPAYLSALLLPCRLNPRHRRRRLNPRPSPSLCSTCNISASFTPAGHTNGAQKFGMSFRRQISPPNQRATPVTSTAHWTTQPNCSWGHKCFYLRVQSFMIWSLYSPVSHCKINRYSCLNRWITSKIGKKKTSTTPIRKLGIQFFLVIDTWWIKTQHHGGHEK